MVYSYFAKEGNSYNKYQKTKCEECGEQSVCLEFDCHHITLCKKHWVEFVEKMFTEAEAESARFREVGTDKFGNKLYKRF